MTSLSSAFRVFTPTAAIRSRDWFRESVFTHEDTGGQPYDELRYPHITAPGGPADALDDKRVQNIWLQWGSRLGKSFFSQCATLFMAENQPCPMMIAGPDEKITKEVILRTYGMMRNSRVMRKHLKPERRRRQDRIDFLRCRMYAAWSRSVSTLADKAVRFGHGGEIDKWEHEGASSSKAKEADPLKLFTDRGKEFPTRKFVLESTPTIKGRSRIENGRLQSTNCKLHVPCPHCGKYQALTMEHLRWEKLETGKHDKDQARKTARYECEHCEKAILDEHRSQMMRRGVWVPEGCTVNHEGAAAMFVGDRKPWRGWSLAEWIEGEPSRNGTDAGYQLSSLYALSLGWGDIAAEFVGCKEKPQNLRNFINQWLAETWEEVRRKATWEDVGIKLIDKEVRPGIVPAWASLVTVGIDRQQDNRFPYSVEAWGPDRRNATIAYGEAQSFDELRIVLARQWSHADGQDPLPCSFALMDSGFRPDGVYEFCLAEMRKGRKVFPSKGSSTALNADWTVAKLGTNTSLPGMVLYHIDTVRSQLWLDHAIHDVPRGDPGSICLYDSGLNQHEDYLQQLINDAPVEQLDNKQNVRESWQRINTAIPNDWRDCKRYGYTGMLIHTGGGMVQPRKLARQSAIPATQPQDEGDGGRFRRMDLRRR